MCDITSRAYAEVREDGVRTEGVVGRQLILNGFLSCWKVELQNDSSRVDEAGRVRIIVASWS